MSYTRSLALPLLLALAALPACSQTPPPSATAPSTAVPIQKSPQILIKALIVETDQAALNKLFPEPAVGSDFPMAPANRPGAGAHVGLFAQVGLLEGETLAIFRQLAADSQLSVLSRPYLLTNPDEKAQLQVGQEIPSLTSYKPRNPADPATDYDPVIKYVFAGINLFCTPHILPNSLISLDVDYSSSQLLRIDAQPAPGTPANKQLHTMTPIFHTSSALTRVAIRNNETILIVGRSPTQPPADAKVQILFLTPHLALLPDGTPAPAAPEVLK